ncbi:hypothetical protein GX865_02845 [Candidatus Saccharibacteria bacterium]|jgi:hypothetical protein|nr:hypothetical protein [Candidatus Saccharibacteria bacterium]
MESFNYREVDGDILPPYGLEFGYEMTPDIEELYYQDINSNPPIQDRVNLEVRRRSLLSAADMYAEGASHEHFSKKPDDYKGLKEHFKDYSFADERRILAPAIGVNAEDWINGKLSADDFGIAMGALYSIRRAIGKSAGEESRNKVRKKLKRKQPN